MFTKGHNKGFTLIELLVVIAIIGILASIVLVSLNGARGKARDAERVSGLKEMAKAASLIDNDPATPFVGCTTDGPKANTCTTPALAAYSDPSAIAATAACGSASAAICDYSVSAEDGVLGNGEAINSQNYEFCAYLEGPNIGFSGGTAAGHLVRVSSASAGSVVAGCL